MKSLRSYVSIFVAVALLAIPGTSVAETATTGNVDVSLSIAANPVQTVDPNGAVDRVLLEVANGGTATIVFVRVDFPTGAAAAAYQDTPPAGWVMDVKGHADGRDYVTYTGALGPSQSASFHLRTVDLDAGEEFRVSFDTLSAVTTLPPPAVDLAPTATPTADPLCLQIPLSTAGPVELYLPVGAVADGSTPFATSASVLTVLYDKDHRTYLDATAVSNTLKVQAPVSGQERPLTMDADKHVLGLVDTPAGPVLTPAVEGSLSFDVAKRSLWTGTGSAEWFVSSPGQYLVTSEAGTCTPLAFTVVPPQVDSDLDGFININELRSNAHPLLAASTPYSDDDGDGVLNGRDPVNTWMLP